MGLYYCHGCDSHHDSKDGFYTVIDGNDYCESAVADLFPAIAFTINGVQYWVERDTPGYFWGCATGDGEAVYFPTAWAAQQDAIRFHQAIIDDESEYEAQRLEDEAFGSYEQQIHALYYSTRL